MATASVSAETRSDGRATAAAAYVRPVSSRTAAPSADPTRALADRASVMIFKSSGPSSASVTRLSLVSASPRAATPSADRESPRGGNLASPRDRLRQTYFIIPIFPAKVAHEAAVAPSGFVTGNLKFTFVTLCNAYALTCGNSWSYRWAYSRKWPPI